MPWQPEQKIMLYQKKAFSIDLALTPLGVVASGAPCVGAVAQLLRWRSIGDACAAFAIALTCGFFSVWFARRALFLSGLRSCAAVSAVAGELRSWDHKGRLRNVEWSGITEVRITRWALTVCWSGTDGPQRLVLKYPEAWRPGLASWLPEEIARRAGLDERTERWRPLAPGWETAYRRTNPTGRHDSCTNAQSQ